MKPEQLLKFSEIDEVIERAVKAGGQKQFHRELRQLVEAVRSNGQKVPDDLIIESNLVLPDVDVALEGVRGLLDSTSKYYGLIPSPEAGLESAQSE